MAPLRWPDLVCLCPLSGGDGPGPAKLRLPPYRGRLRFVFLAARGDVSAQLRAGRRVAQLRRQGIAAHAVQTQPRGRNPKVSQLAQVPERLLAGAGVALVLDGDVDLATVEATALVRRLLAEPRLGLVWQPTVPGGRGAGGIDRLAAAIFTASHFSMPVSALFAPQVAVGKVLAYRPETLQMVGGWAACAHVIGEDLHASQMVQAMGLSVSPLDAPPAHSVRRQQGLSCLARRLVRWHRIVWEQAPSVLLVFPAFVLFWPMQVLVWATSVRWLPLLPAALCLMVATAVRLSFAWVATRASGRRPTAQSCLLALVGDGLLLATLVRALSSGRLTWHGKGVARGQWAVDGALPSADPSRLALPPRAA